MMTATTAKTPAANFMMMVPKYIDLINIGSSRRVYLLYLKERPTHWTSGLTTGFEPSIKANRVELVFAGLAMRPRKRLVIGL